MENSLPRVNIGVTPLDFNNQQLVDAGDAAGVMKLLTNEKVEEQVLTRARLKATTYGREPLMYSLPQVSDGDLDGITAIIAAAAAQAVVAAVEAVRGGGFCCKLQGEG